MRNTQRRAEKEETLRQYHKQGICEHKEMEEEVGLDDDIQLRGK